VAGVDKGVSDGAAISIRIGTGDFDSKTPTAERPAEIAGSERGPATPTALDESLLVERAKSDRRAFAPLYLAHYGAILAHIFRRVGDAHASQDIAAETFIRAMNGIGRFQQRGLSFGHWLLRIATNEVNRHLERERRRRGRERIAARHTDGGSECARNETAEHVSQALKSLSVEHQAVLALHYFEGLGVEEMALVLGTKAGTVKSRLSRARSEMARVLGDGEKGTEGVR
jgi:RNA polymerase sigma-70 factor (ECF subfamily)